MIALFLKAYWKPLAIAGAVFVAVVIFNVWLAGAKSAAHTRGFEKARIACVEAREAAQRSRDAQIEAIRKEEARKRQELQDRLDAERKRNAALDTEITEARRTAARVRREAERQSNEALQADGLAGCVPTDGVSDALADAGGTGTSMEGQGEVPSSMTKLGIGLDLDEQGSFDQNYWLLAGVVICVVVLAVTLGVCCCNKQTVHRRSFNARPTAAAPTHPLSSGPPSRLEQALCLCVCCKENSKAGAKSLSSVSSQEQETAQAIPLEGIAENLEAVRVLEESPSDKAHAAALEQQRQLHIGKIQSQRRAHNAAMRKKEEAHVAALQEQSRLHESQLEEMQRLHAAALHEKDEAHAAAATTVCRSCGERIPLEGAEQHGAECFHHHAHGHVRTPPIRERRLL